MTDRQELEQLAEWAKAQGATAIFQEAMDNGGQVYIETLQVIGLKGCGPFPMSAIYAANCASISRK